jgi:hypothetical protein
MPFAPTSPVTGATVAGLTTPTYTLTADTPPNINGKQFAITALGGTQTGVDYNSVSKPFTIAFFRPPVLRTLPQANPLTGVIKNVPLNVYKFNTRKGAAPSVNQTIMVPKITTIIEVPAGVDTYEPEEIRAMISCHFGVGWQSASDISVAVLTGVL